MQNNIINTENNSNNNIIEINNNNAKYYEKLSENYADDARKSAVNCSEYFMLIQRIKNDCEAIKQYLDRDFIGEMNAHTENVENPHYVTAEQVGAYSKEEMADVATTGDYDDLLNKPTIPVIPTAISSFTNDSGYITSSDLDAYAEITDLAEVAISGSYSDLTNKPSIPAAQVNSDWNASSGVAQILNKPIIPTVPTTVSAFTNDSGYITSSALNGYATETWVGNQGYITGITSSNVTTALGYTPYNSSNPNGYTSNVGTVTSVNNVNPVNGNVTLSIPTVPANVSAFTNDSGYVTKTVQTLQDISTTTATINLVDGTSLYKITPSGATTFTFSNGTTASAIKAYTFELCIDMSTVYALTFPSSVTWQDGETPDLSSTGRYFLAFRTMDGGTTWLGNLQGRW